nr:hypothetical protein [uncultured archaeon]AQS34145.1 hypothetical protein [uncultured archaeon]
MVDDIDAEQFNRFPWARVVSGGFWGITLIWAGSCIYHEVAGSIKDSEARFIENYASFQTLRYDGASEEILRRHFPEYDAFTEYAASTQPS